tara:strand:+ start:16752 stop:17054 length:303 start_codon:yes stop_codon:yes gene_type:complete
MNKTIVTEERLIKLIQRVIKEQEESTDVSTTDVVTSHPLAEKVFTDIKNHMEATAGAFTLRDIGTTENVEDDKLKKTWKWKTNDGHVKITASLDIQMIDK